VTDPRGRLGLLVCLGVAAVCVESAAGLGLLAALAGAPALRSPAARRRWPYAVGGVAALVWSSCLSQGLFYPLEPRVPLVRLGPVTVWREGVLWGLVQSLRLSALSLGALSLAVTTPPERLVAALRALGVPFGLALMASSGLRFLPQLGAELWAARRARAARGRAAWRRAPWAWLAVEARLLGPVLARGWRRAHALAESLDARGFDPVAPRTAWRPLRMGRGDLASLSLVVALTVTLVVSRGLFLLYVNDLLYVPLLRPLYGFVRAWL
jgi:energy-coupling factor transport system permease protein